MTQKLIVLIENLFVTSLIPRKLKLRDLNGFFLSASCIVVHILIAVIVCQHFFDRVSAGHITLKLPLLFLFNGAFSCEKSMGNEWNKRCLARGKSTFNCDNAPRLEALIDCFNLRVVEPETCIWVTHRIVLQGIIGRALID